MNKQCGFLPLLLIALVAISAGIGIYFSASDFPSFSVPFSIPGIQPKGETSVCTKDVEQCPDGSYVGRTGLKCEFAPCPDGTPQDRIPTSYRECTSNGQCPANAICEAVESTGVIFPEGGGEPISQITKGYCKLKTGGACKANADCGEGICYAGVCTQPIGRQCNGGNDRTCPANYECAQSCGPPVVRTDEPPLSYFCQLKGYQRPCPICLASDTHIATPSGDVVVTELRLGMKVWSQDTDGTRIPSAIIRVSRTPVVATHLMVRLTLEDLRTLLVSPGHPSADNRTIADLVAGEFYDGSRITVKELVRYNDGATYDLLPDSATGYYWANGILLGSTLK